MAASRTRVATLALADAVLSSGAVLSAAEGGLPQRITTPGPINLPTYAGSSPNSGIAWGDNDSIWHPEYNTGTLRHLDLEGNVLHSITGLGYVMGLSRRGDSIFVSRYGNNIIEERDVADGTLLNSCTVALSGGKPPAQAVQVQDGKLWIFPYAGTAAEEWTIPGGAATGRTLTCGAGIATDGTNLIAKTSGGSQIVRRWRESDLAIVDSFTTPPGNFENAGYGYGGYWGLAYEPDPTSGGLFIKSGIFGPIDLWVGGAFSQRLLFGSGTQYDVNGWSVPSQGMRDGTIARHPDGTYFATTEIPWGQGNATLRAPRIHDMRTARAEWTRVFTAAASLQFAILPGMIGSTQASDYDFRKTRFYYSTNGVDFTESIPGTPLSVAIAAGTTLIVRADMTTWGTVDKVPPWIGGDAGEGPSLIWTEDDPHGPDATVTVRTPAAIAVTVQTPPRITVTVRS